MTAYSRNFMAAGLCLIWPTLVLAQPQLASDEVTVVNYDVTGKTLRELQQDMKARGPQGFWAYTKTNWNWDGQCNMMYKATITMPNLASRDNLNAADLVIWDRMVGNLHSHEMEHVEIGRRWATEIKQANCDPASVAQIDARNKGSDAELDRRTDHGRLSGVHLNP